MKKLFYFAFSFIAALSLCINVYVSAEDAEGKVTEDTYNELATESEDTEVSDGIADVVSLDGKTVMLVGNSMVFYGNCVISGNQGQEDYGYFYQLIASNGENAKVIDHTYSGKKLDFIYENYLSKLPSEELAEVDYVVVSEGNQVNEDLVGTCERILSLFPETTELRFLRQPNMFDDMGVGLPCLIEGVEKLREAGYKIVDWGKLVYDIYTGETEVPGATLDFVRSTFMKENLGYKNLSGTAVSQGGNGDRNHINPLAGYVTAQMLYSSITNRSAVFSDYSFCWDKSIHIYFDLPEFNRVHYTGNVKSNFCEVFASAPDMLGLQKLIDIYLSKEGIHPLTVQKKINATCTSNGLTQGSYCSLCGKVAKTQQIIERMGEHQLTFVKGNTETCTEYGLTDGISCSICNEVIKSQQKIPAREHSGLTEIIKATNKKDGKITVTCKYCNEVLKNEIISAAKQISLSQTTYIYDGNSHFPSVTVADGGKNMLTEGTDYTVSFPSESTMPGKYTVKVTLKGNYSGTYTLNYTIAPQAVSEISASVEDSEINLSWNEVEGATGYKVYKAVGEGLIAGQSAAAYVAELLRKQK